MNAIEGRWTLNYTKVKPAIEGPEPKGTWDEPVRVPVVPCDEAAVDRVTFALGQYMHNSSHTFVRSAAAAALIAAGETP